MNRRAPLSAAGLGRSVLGLVLALGVLAALVCGAGGRARAAIRLTADGPVSSTPAAGGRLAGTWKLLPSAPVTVLPPAYSIASVWTGREMIIHGIVITPAGARGVNFAYRPATNTWTRLPSGPHPILAQLDDVAVWTGSEMLVLGLTSAAYSSGHQQVAPHSAPEPGPGPGKWLDWPRSGHVGGELLRQAGL